MKKLSLIISLVILLVLVQLIPLTYAWETERPGGSLHFDEAIYNRETDGLAAVGLGVAINDYTESDGEYGGADSVSLNITMTTNCRMGIHYSRIRQDLGWVSEGDLYNPVIRTGVGDDWGEWVNIPTDDMGYPIIFRFYGGAGSFEYDTVWICSNGFIAFDLSNSTSSTPSMVSPSEPNAIIAALWSDLVIDDQASIIYGVTWDIFNEYFVVIWKNALHKASEKRLTFQIKLEDAPPYDPVYEGRSQSRIWISWQNVSAINTIFGCGIEDQEGYKGLGGLGSGDGLNELDGKTDIFMQYSNSYYLRYVSLWFYDEHPNTRYDVLLDKLGGMNVRLKTEPAPHPEESGAFIRAVGSSTVLLLTYAGIALGESFLPITLPVSTILVIGTWKDLLARAQYSLVDPIALVDCDTAPGTRPGYVKAAAYNYSVDVTLSTIFNWVLDTDNTVRHSLRVRALVEYTEMISTGQKNDKWIDTEVNLEIGPDDNNDWSTADPIQTGVTYARLYIGGYDTTDFYKINIPILETTYIKANATSSLQPEKPYYEIYVYDPSHNQKAYSSAKYDHDFEFVPTVTGDWFIKFHLVAAHGFYSFYVGTRETFYFRSDKATVNGLFTEKLLISQSGTVGYKTRTDTDPECAITRAYWGVRVYKRSSAGVETQITSSTSNPVARVYRDCTSEGIQSATWPCPETPLATTDSIVIRVYTALYDPDEGFYPWQLQGTWSTTPQLGATKLSASTWTIYYYTYWLRQRTTPITLTSRFYYDTSTYNSRITGITYQ
jgi:hypothetical protein